MDVKSEQSIPSQFELWEINHAIITIPIFLLYVFMLRSIGYRFCQELCILIAKINVQEHLHYT